MDGDDRDQLAIDRNSTFEVFPQSARTSSRAAIGVLVTQARPGASSRTDELYLAQGEDCEYVACANPRCSDGGLYPAPLIHELIDGSPDELRVVACEGREKVKHGAGRGARCDTLFCVRLVDAGS